jgi:hypothetical protein
MKTQMVLERGEKLELLVDRADQLQSQAFQFHKSCRKLRDAMFWKKVTAERGKRESVWVSQGLSQNKSAFPFTRRILVSPSAQGADFCSILTV